MNDNILNIAAVSKWYKSGSDRLHILDGVSCTLKSGLVYILKGESGSGKTTLLNLIGGLDSVSEGAIIMEGENISLYSEQRLTLYRQQKIGFVFQFHYLLKEFTAIENVMLPLYMAGESRKSSTLRAKEILCEVGMAERLHHFPTQLSGGERPRVAIARSLINDPDIVLADEPTGNLDEKNSQIVEKLLFDTVQNHGKTLFVATHNSTLAAKGNVVLRLKDKKLILP
jgi:lipoprotein-releasing system ATP-binding protein